ncbi:hypothetical protein C4573_02355 [Candidatus Woesearchaeota archaeon]|nr:MAG: hypothetical protein C4573_02355 [Candidatus Woesearchaeota archaeon]
MKYFTKCGVCGIHIELDDLPQNPVPIINIYLGRRLVNTYCSLECLKKKFKQVTVPVINHIWFFKYKTKMHVWINRKKPKVHYKVIFTSIQYG